MLQIWSKQDGCSDAKAVKILLDKAVYLNNLTFVLVLLRCC